MNHLYTPSLLNMRKLWSYIGSVNNKVKLLGLNGGTGSPLILTSADGQNWQIGVTNLGALTTEETATQGVSSITIPSNDGTKSFTLGVNNSGALTTEEII